MSDAPNSETPPMFTPFTLRDLTVSNRVVMSPMCMYFADDLDGTPTDFHVVHLCSRAMGGAGLVMTEMTQVSREGRISPGDADMYDDKHVDGWKRVVDFVHTRTDAYGGSLENRMNLPLEVFRAVRAVWPEEKPISARISAIDWNDDGNQIEDGVEIAKMFKAAGLDIIDVSSGNVTSERRPVTPGLFQTPFSEQIRREADMPTMTVGNLAVAEQINGVIEEGRADLCCVGKGHLFDPYFVRHAARELGYDLKWPN